MTEETLREIEERCEAATNGPWEESDLQPGQVLCDVYGDDGVWELVCMMWLVEDHMSGSTLANARFVAHAREDVPALLKEVRRLRAERDAQKRAVQMVDELLCVLSCEYGLAKQIRQALTDEQSHGSFVMDEAFRAAGLDVLSQSYLKEGAA